MIRDFSNRVAKRILFGLLLLFTVCCFKLCAEDLSPAEAQVQREKFVAEAKKYVGCPYVLGAVGPDSFDCSGLVYFVARESIQKQLPRTAKALYSYCRVVPDSKKEVGDLLFFKTNNSGAAVTHVGIYIGHNQFISAISDGPNTGVIISSLNQDYWKPKYVGCGQFLKSGNGVESDDEWEEEVVVAEGNKGDSPRGSKTRKSEKNRNNGDSPAWDIDSLIFDSALYANWSLLTPKSFMIQWRGLDLQSNVRYSKWALQPGVGVYLRYNGGLDVFQMPIVVSTTLNEYLRVYAGPVFSFGSARMLETKDTIKPSIFPGILGISLSTPSFNVKKAKVQIVQDISYTIFNNLDNSALSFVDSLSAGVVFSTGVRVSLGMKAFRN